MQFQVIRKDKQNNLDFVHKQLCYFIKKHTPNNNKKIMFKVFIRLKFLFGGTHLPSLYKGKLLHKKITNRHPNHWDTNATNTRYKPH